MVELLSNRTLGGGGGDKRFDGITPDLVPFWTKQIAERSLRIVEILSSIAQGGGGLGGDGLKPDTGGPFWPKFPPGSPITFPPPVYLSADIRVEGGADPEVTARAVREQLEQTVNSQLGSVLTEQRRARGLRPVDGLPR